MARNPIRDIWNRIRAWGRKVEEEVYDFTEEDSESDEEPRGRNTLIALTNGFMTMWKASQANAAERTLGVLGFAGLFYFLVVDRGMGWRKWWFGLPAGTFAIIWFVPGVIAGCWTMGVNLGWGNLRKWRSWPIFGVFMAAGLISFRGVFSELANRRIRPVRRS